MKIVVIGGGVAGLSIGWRLRQAGAEVTVLERAQPGRGATWASAGMIAALAEMEDTTAPLAEFGKHSARQWPEFACEIEEASGIDIGFRVDGTLLAVRSREEAAGLRAHAGAGQTFLSPGEAREAEPLLSDDIAGALLDPGEAQVDNRALGPALGLAFQRAGGKLSINEPVIRIEGANGRALAARTPFALHGADAFVVAAGAWSSRIEGLPPEAVPSVVPVKGEMLALAPEGVALPKHMIWGNEIYLVPRGGRLLVGATVTQEGFDTRPTQQAAQWLYSHAVALMPALAKWAMVEHWAGLRPGSPDDLPLLGPTLLDRLFVASGQFRNGILLAPAFAEAARDIVLHKASPESAFDPRRFAPQR